jgi:hypothetical protein
LLKEQEQEEKAEAPPFVFDWEDEECEEFAFFAPLSKSKRLKCWKEPEEKDEELRRETDSKDGNDIEQSIRAATSLWQENIDIGRAFHCFSVEEQFQALWGSVPPLLNTLIKALRNCPATETSCERFFSLLGRLLTPLRGRTNPEVILTQAVVCRMFTALKED